jgi:hypothetical protein
VTWGTVNGKPVDDDPRKLWADFWDGLFEDDGFSGLVTGPSTVGHGFWQQRPFLDRFRM